jgi:putative membrane protein
MKIENLGEAAIDTAVFAAIGLAVFGIAFWLIVKIAPFSVKKEIEDDQNTALAIIIAGVLIGISLIIAAAISGS